MIKLSLLVVVSCIIATGYLQEVKNDLLDATPNKDDATQTKELWLQQFHGVRRNGKPCPRRSNSNPDGSWQPSYSSRITHPLFEPTVLEPQALKNEGYRESQANSPDLYYSQYLASDLHSTTDDDCVEQLKSVNVGSSTEPNAEKTALKIIEDCLKKKKKSQDALLSRRSMSGPDSFNNDDDRDLQDSDFVDSLDGYNADEPDAVRRKGDQEKDGGLQKKNNLKDLRVCYACSTATNPTCANPDMRTTIKYCAKEQSCATKTFAVNGQETIVRDCANTCTDTSPSGLQPKYKSCKLCHKDYCNSAMGVVINIYSLGIVLIISMVKCTY